MDTKVITSGISHSNLPESYVRSESERPPPLSKVSTGDEIIPVMELGSDNGTRIVQQTRDACEDYGRFQVRNPGISREDVEKMLGVAGEFSTIFNVIKERVHSWRDYIRLHSYPLYRHESFFAGTTGMLAMLATAFTAFSQHAVLSLPWRSFMESNYCVMMMLSTTALVADVRLQSADLNPRTRRCSEILRTVVVLTGSLAIISLLFISKPYIAAFFLFMWFFLAIYLSLNLYGNLTQRTQPPTVNTTSNSISA